MSKDGSAGGGTNISLDNLLAMNPEFIEQMATEPAAQSNAPVAAPTLFYGTGNEISQPDQTYFDTFASPTENFYGSGTEITQPDADYYNQFPLPGQSAAPVDQATQNAAGRAAEVERLAADPVMNFTQDPNISTEEEDEIFTIRQKIQQNEEMARRGFDVPTGFSRVGAQGQEVFPELDLGMRGQDLLSATTTPSRVVPAMPILDAAEEDEEMRYYTPRFNNFNIGAM
tara:strand:+ start:36 stop:719 length:684 start_codon:yes stop_codon:yes gene_type:complete